MLLRRKKEEKIMILKSKKLLYGALLLCLPSILSANLSSLQSWDPYPIFNAANLNTPPDTQFCTIVKRNIIDDKPGKRRKIGINFSPFVQRAIRAQQGPNNFYGDYSTGVDANGVPLPKAPGTEMSDYQGTPYLMGLLLGADEYGNSIWVGNADTGITTDITSVSVGATSLPLNLQNTVLALNGLYTGESTGDALLYNVATNDTFTSPSILSQSVLEQDRILFGAFSVPLIYQKTGLRFELNFDISDNFGLIVQGGACQISQTAGAPIPLTAITPINPTQTPATIYAGLTDVTNAAASVSVPVPACQAIFNEWVTNNIDDLLAPIENGGVNYDITSFTNAGFEDLRFIFFARHTFAMVPHEDEDSYASMLITTYATLGLTAPLAAVKNYSEIYALPLGNNGHASVGGTVGMTFDFIDSVEIGLKGGATFFLPKDIYQMPCPNHPLQRVLYPFRRDFKVSPGFNWNFGANLNAIEFIKNISFLFTYDFIQHSSDTLTPLAGSIGDQYFYPYILENLSPWTSQMFTAALDFKLQPGIYLSIAWQGALAQSNAYCSNTILGSLNFLF